MSDTPVDTLTVTLDDWNEAQYRMLHGGEVSICCNCVVSVAAERQFDEEYVSTTAHFVNVGGNRFDMKEDGTKLVNDFDRMYRQTARPQFPQTINLYRECWNRREVSKTVFPK
jgi:hypothetical protein